MAEALRAAGNPAVSITEVVGRDHGSIWSGLAGAGDEVAEQIRRFVTAAADASPSLPR